MVKRKYGAAIKKAGARFYDLVIDNEGKVEVYDTIREAERDGDATLGWHGWHGGDNIVINLEGILKKSSK